MIVDTSALVAIVLDEELRPNLLETMAAAARRGIGTPTLVESGIVLFQRRGVGSDRLRRILRELDVDEVEFTGEHWAAAVAAFVRFGKGRHAARLNFGDCMTYAVASIAGEPLLCVGDDFAKTDLALAG